MAEEGVLNYLTVQNRPYSVTDIFMNLHNKFGKTAVQKALDTLVLNGSVKEKEYGKQKIYCVVQDNSFSDEGARLEMNVSKEKVKQLSEELATIKRKLRTSEYRLKRLEATPAEVAMEQQKVLQERVIELRARLENPSKNKVTVSKEQRDEVIRKYELYTRHWRKRKSCCMNIVDSVSENYPKSKKELLEELGIETDEAVGVSLPPPWNNRNSCKRKCSI